MNVLVVAPDMALQNVEDWVAAAQGLRLTVLNRHVSVREVLERIASGCFEVVHFATDGQRNALGMSDGLIPGPMLEDALASAGNVELVILGACKSVLIGAAIYRAGVPRVLSWRDAVDDKVAVAWAKAFYSSLHMNGGVGRIWDASQTAAEVVRDMGAEPPIYLNGRLVILEAEVRRLQGKQRTQIAGVPVWLAVVLAGQGALLAGLLFFLVLR